MGQWVHHVHISLDKMYISCSLTLLNDVCVHQWIVNCRYTTSWKDKETWKNRNSINFLPFIFTNPAMIHHKSPKAFDQLNTLKPRQNGRHFADDMFKCIFLNDNILILIKISLKFVPRGSINNIPALIQIMAWRRPGDKPLSEPMMVYLPTHICVTRPQWVN